MASLAIFPTMEWICNENNQASGLSGLSSQGVAGGSVVRNSTTAMTSDVIQSKKLPVSHLLVHGNCVDEPDFQIHPVSCHLNVQNGILPLCDGDQTY